MPKVSPAVALVAVAFLESVNCVGLTIVATVAPLGIPVPTTTRPTTRSAVLTTVTVAEPVTIDAAVLTPALSTQIVPADVAVLNQKLNAPPTWPSRSPSIVVPVASTIVLAASEIGVKSIFRS